MLRGHVTRDVAFVQRLGVRAETWHVSRRGSDKERKRKRRGLRLKK